MSTILFHVQFGIVARSKGGDARKISAYQSASRMERRDGKPFDFRRKRGEHAGHVMMVPDGAPMWAADPTQLWQRAEDAERRGDAQVARMIEIAVPREVAANRRVDFVRHVCGPWIADGMAAQIDLHCTTAADGAEQPHVHILLTMRKFDGGCLAAKKERTWNSDFTADKGRAMRDQVAARMNDWMALQGIAARVDHRSFADQGINSPAPERNVSKKAWAAHRADTTSEAAEPVREVLAQRTDRRTARRDIAWEAARVAYAEAAAMHYAAEKQRRQAAYVDRRRAEQEARTDLRTRQRADRDRTYRHTRRGIVRNVLLAVQQGAHVRQSAVLDTEQQATHMTAAKPAAQFPGFDQWIEERAAEGDRSARAAMDQRQSRREWLARKDPLAAARRNLDDAIRAADRVLRGHPRASVDDDVLFVAARDRLAACRDKALRTARVARQAVWDHHRSASFWRRWTDSTWGAEHSRLIGAANMARQRADRFAARYDGDVRIARNAARQAASFNRRVLAAWLDRADVRAAQATRATAERVRTALDEGNQDTINAAAHGDLPAAAQAAQAAEEHRAAKAGRQRDKDDANQAAVQQAAKERASEAAQRAAARRQVPVQAPQPTLSATPTLGLRLR